MPLGALNCHDGRGFGGFFFFHFFDALSHEVQELALVKAMLLPGCEHFSFFVPFGSMEQWNHFSEM